MGSTPARQTFLGPPGDNRRRKEKEEEGRGWMKEEDEGGGGRLCGVNIAGNDHCVG